MLLVEHAAWDEHCLTVALREPWKTLQNTLTTTNEGVLAFSQEWPARADSNRRPTA